MDNRDNDYKHDSGDFELPADYDPTAKPKPKEENDPKVDQPMTPSNWDHELDAFLDTRAAMAGLTLGSVSYKLGYLKMWFARELASRPDMAHCSGKVGYGLPSRCNDAPFKQDELSCWKYAEPSVRSLGRHSPRLASMLLSSRLLEGTKMLVYRCENPETGQGPFNCDYETYLAVRPALRHVFNNLSRFPTFWGNKDDDRLGCETKRQFSYWFPKKSRETLSKQGFKLLIFDVPEEDTRIGPNQIAFKRDDKFKVAELDLDTSPNDWYAKPSTLGAAP